jgi:glutathione synthase/RimK-type ligase-like ATP-grasp enzyme
MDGVGLISATRAAVARVASTLMDDVARDAPPVRAALFYSKGQALGGVRGDDQVILGAMRAAGLESEIVDLGHLSQAADGAFLLTDPATGIARAWEPPHAALMYHGAIAPDNAMPMLAAIEESGTTVVNGSRSWPLFTDKLAYAQYMEPRGVRVIPSTTVSSADEMRATFARHDGAAVFKAQVGTEGEDIFVVRSAAELDEAIEALPRNGGRFLAQPMVDARIGNSLEPAIFDTIAPRMASQINEQRAAAGLPRLAGEELEQAIRNRRIEFRIHHVRHADGSVEIPGVYARVTGTDDQVIGNVAQGAVATRIDFADLDPADQAQVLRAATAMPEGGDVGGFDLIGTPGKRYIIEDNSGPGLPNAAEGFDPAKLVSGYGVRLRDAALGSSLLTRA